MNTLNVMDNMKVCDEIKEYCYNCDENKTIIIKEESIKMKIKEIAFDFVGKVAYCKECGEEV